MPTLFEAGIEVLTLLLLHRGLRALLGFFGLLGGGVHIHNMHVTNTVRPLRPEVSDKDITIHPLPVL